MKKNPISIEEDTLAATALSIMNSKKITSLYVHKKKEPKRQLNFAYARYFKIKY